MEDELNTDDLVTAKFAGACCVVYRANPSHSFFKMEPFQNLANALRRITTLPQGTDCHAILTVGDIFLRPQIMEMLNEARKLWGDADLEVGKMLLKGTKDG